METSTAIATTGQEVELGYNSQLPSFVRDGIKEEISNWKNEIIEGFKKVDGLLLSSDEKDENTIKPKWFTILNSSIKLFHRYITNTKYPLNVSERVVIFELALNILINKQLDLYLELKAKLANLIIILMKNKYHKLLQQNIKPITCWKRLYEMLRSVYFTKNRCISYNPSGSFGKSIVKLVCKLRNNFASETTEEVLNEFTPRLYFSDSEFFISQAFLCLFLPSNTSVEVIDKWFNQVLAMWDWRSNSPFYDLNIVSLLYRLVKDQDGKIDFKPHLDLIFTRMLRSMDLNIGSNITSSSVASGVATSKLAKNVQGGSQNSTAGMIQVLTAASGYSYHSYPNNNCSIFWKLSDLKNLLMQYNSQLISYLLLSFPTETLTYLRRLFQSIDQYYYPSNNGEWSRPLSIFISELFRNVSLNTKESSKDLVVSDDTIEELIRIVFPSCKMALFSKSVKVSKNAIQAIKHICFIRPSCIVQELFEIVFHALQTLTEVHQISVALELLNTIIIPLLYHSIPEVKDYMADLLNMALLGIDTNDSQKTSLTISFLNTLFSIMPIISNNQFVEGTPYVVELYQDFALEFVRRVLHVMGEMTTHKEESKEQKEVYNHLSKSIVLFFQQLSPNLHKQCLNKIISYLQDEFKPAAVKQIGEIANCSVNYFNNGDDTYDPFGLMMNSLISRITNQKGELKDLHDNEMDYYVHLLAKVVKGNNQTFKHCDKLLQILKLTWNSESKSIVKSSGKLLKNILQSLTTVYILEKRSVPPNVWRSEDFQKNHFKYWGQLYNSKNVDAQWHVPNESELEKATTIFNDYSRECFTTIKNATTNQVTRDQLLNALLKAKYILKGASLMLDEIRDGQLPEYTKQIVKDFSNTNAGCIVIPNDKLEFTRNDILVLLQKLLADFVQNQSVTSDDSKKNDVRVLIALTKAIHICAAYRSLSFTKMVNMAKIWSLLKLHFFKSTVKKLFPRCFILDRCQMLFISRVFQRTIPCTQVHLDALESLKILSTSCEYAKVRSRAQTSFIGILKLFNNSTFEKFVTPIIETLSNRDSTHAMINGSIFLLEKSSVIRRVTDSWVLISKLLPSICNCYHVDKSSIQKRLYGLYMQYSTAFKELPINNQKTLQYYNDTVNSLVNLSYQLSQSLFWNYQLITISCLNLLIRSDKSIILPIEAIKCFMNNLVSDHVPLRLLCMKALDFIFTQYKPIQPRIEITDSTQIEKVARHHKASATIQDIATQEEFEKTLFLDKYYIGWNAMPKSMVTYDYTKERIFKDETVQLQQLIRNTMFQEEYLSKVFSYFSDDTNGQSNNRAFTKAHAQMFKGFFQIMGIEGLKVIEKHFEHLLSASGTGNADEFSKICFASEIFAGVCRGSKHWKFNDRKQAQDYLFEKISTVIDSCSPQCIESGLRSSFHFCMFDADGRRTKPLVDFLTGKVNLDYGLAAVQMKVLQLVFFTLAELDWRLVKLLENFIEEKLFNHLSHPYQQIRELIARNVSLVFLKSWNPVRDENYLPKSPSSGGQQSLFAQFLNELISNNATKFNMDENGLLSLPSNIFNIVQTDMNRSEFIQNKLIPKLQTEFSKLYQEYTQKLSEKSAEQSHKTKPSQEEMTFKSLCKTIIESIGTSMMFGITVTLPYFNSILPLFLQCFTCSNDTDITISASGIIARIGAFLIPAFMVKELLYSLMFIQKLLMTNQANTSSRKARLVLCFFLQKFAFKHQFFILGTSAENDFYNHLLLLLKDKTVEVKDMACNTLAGFIKIASDDRVEIINAHFSAEHQKHFATKKSGNVEQIQKLDANYVSVGLSALAKAFPYSIPPFVPQVLVKLSRFSSYQKSEQETVDIQFLSDTIKNTFTQFMKTHHEQWEEHKKQFTEDELYTVNQLLYSPVYYA
ncbi:predicted protein [Naegleria gruberi]|uniref:Predicted protein n=1 Tax=Naegleria gruberi TaxID=5762 RepID=D2W0E7_NAEGR|nr:uncharacterized protein NAEGRDRAFT_81922 [Naegleria gruberi]EFC37419.1 predicted protein [Naegleria gruberi]|eukprot:XP_002670163.1 predicted protein [Naegleria gruberi strain NEG-M]